MRKLTFKNVAYKDYFYDADTGTVFSTKRPGPPYAMTWTAALGGYEKRVTLQNGCTPVSVARSRIMDMLKPQCAEVSNCDYVVSKPVTKTKTTANTFVIGTVTAEGRFLFSTDPKAHLTEALAKTEAARLASVAPTERFVVMKIVGVVKATGVVWE